MKKLPVSMLAVFLLAILGNSFVFAQADELEGVYVQTGRDGAFAESEDGTYTLTLNEVPERTPWLVYSPNALAGTDETAAFYLSWAAIEDLSADAVLEVRDLSITMELSNPVFDASTGSIEFTATDVEFVSLNPDDKKNPTLPEEFGKATLFISLDASFDMQLQEGYALALEGQRTGNSGRPLNSKVPPQTDEDEDDEDEDEESDEDEEDEDEDEE